MSTNVTLLANQASLEPTMMGGKVNVLMWWALSYAQLIPRTVNGDFVKTMHRATTPVDPDVHLFDVQKIGGIDDNTDKSGRLTDNQSTKNW